MRVFELTIDGEQVLVVANTMQTAIDQHYDWYVEEGQDPADYMDNLELVRFVGQLKAGPE